jgi:uncharacterized protein (TIGR02300 family)
MKLASFEAARSARGNKHVCQACDTRFYDLLRSPITCPSCGAVFTPRAVEVKPAVVPRSRWRKDFAPPRPVVEEEAEAKSDVSSDAAPDDELITEDVKSSHEPDDDSVPEEVQEDTDVSGLLDIGETKDE